MTDAESSDGDIEWPDYTPLKDILIAADGMLAADFKARVGARPFLTYEDGEWRGVSVGPFDSTDAGETIITTKELDISEANVEEMLAEARVVQVTATRETPLAEHDDWVYTGLGEQPEHADDADAHEPPSREELATALFETTAALTDLYERLAGGAQRSGVSPEQVVESVWDAYDVEGAATTAAASGAVRDDDGHPASWAVDERVHIDE